MRRGGKAEGGGNVGVIGVLRAQVGHPGSDLSGEAVESAGPSIPVEVLGFSGTPEAGDRLAVVESEGRAREVTDYRLRQKREKVAARAGTTMTTASTAAIAP